MYYKVENKNCDVYKKLHALREKEIQMEEDNSSLLKEKIGFNFTQFLGYPGQQTFSRVTEYHGFKFIDTNNINLKVWKEEKCNKGIYTPNLRTKLGREMGSFISNGLKKSCFSNVIDILKIEDYVNGRFSFPFVEICNETIILWLDDKVDLENKDVIEITKIEFTSIYKSIKNEK